MTYRYSLSEKNECRLSGHSFFFTRNFLEQFHKINKMVVIMHEINFKTFNMDIFISIMCILYGFICWDVVSTYGNSFTFNIYFFLLYIRIYRLSHTKNYSISYKTSNRLKEITTKRQLKNYMK